MIATIGDLVEDIVVWPATEIHPGTDTVSTIHRRRGGSAANVASTIARTGGRARFIGQVGDDRAGEALTAGLAAAGVDLAVRRAGRTGSLIVVIGRDGERSFFTDRGATIELDGVDPAWLDSVSTLHIPGYTLSADPLATTACDLARLAIDRGITLSIDASSTAVIRTMGTTAFLGLVESLAPGVLFANHDEAALLGLGAGRPAPGVGVTIARDGGAATHVVYPDGHTDTIEVPPVPEVVDTTGAGDAFAAGWLSAIADGADAHEATVAAHSLAARVLTVPGADLDLGPGDS
ncbi:MAG: carbohydrate kinase family protein [Acidimicrobiales bacterium]